MMSPPPARLLIVDDERASMQALCDTLRDQGYETTGFTAGDDALRALRETPFDLLLTDLTMPGMDGIGLLKAALKIDVQLAGVLMTGAGTIETAVKAMKAGALDYVLKPIRLSAILPVLSRALTLRRLRLENIELRDTVAIHELNQAIAHTLDPNVLLDRIADAALAQFQADEASVMLVDDDERFLYVAAVRGPGRDALLGMRVPVGEGIAGRVAAQREPFVVPSTFDEAGVAPLHPRADIQSALSMPMVTRDKLVGVININCTGRRGAFSVGQVRLLSIFTNTAAAGIEAARLHRDQRKADARYRDVLDMAGDGIISIDEQQRIVIFNAAAEEQFGYTADEAIGKPIEMLLPAPLAEAHRPHVQAFGQEPGSSRPMAGRKPLFGRRKDGTLFNAEVNISQRTEDGRILYSAVVRDVTQRVRQEERVARLTRIHAVLSGISSAIVHAQRRDELLAQACRIAVDQGGFGFAWAGVVDSVAHTVTQVAIAGLETAGLFDAAAPIPWDRGVLGRAILGKSPAFITDLLEEPESGGPRRKAAIERGYLSVIVLPLLIDGAVVANMTLYARSIKGLQNEEIELLNRLAQDVSFGLERIARADQLSTALHVIEQERGLLAQRVVERTAELTRANEWLERARREAEEASQAKSAFLATMSHEIRTPMNGVIGMAEVLASSRLSEAQAEVVGTIRASGLALLRIIDDILDFSKIEAGRLELERAPVALSELIEGVCDTLLPVAIEKNVGLSLFVSPQVPAQLWSDPTRLRQVVFNLAGNAIKFSAGRAHRRGRVSLRVDFEDGTSPRVVLSIADNGIGIEPEALPRLFTSFSQADASTTRRFGGTGLGLAICRRLATLMNGDIAVQSTVGEGSTFTVTLPVEVVQGARAQPDPDLTDLDCIVVGSGFDADDLRVYLEHAGARVHQVADRDAAAQRAVGLSRPVVIHNTGPEMPSTYALQVAFAATHNVRHLVIVHASRHGMQSNAANLVTLHADILRRAAVLRAVAVAAGRALPEPGPEIGGGDAAEEPPVPSTFADARAQGRVILVAEDDEVNQKVILRQLEVLGYTAEITSNGVEALERWRKGRYGLLLTDLHMPEMDGYALAEAIRREEAQRDREPRARMPILALTANAMRGEAVRTQAVGMDDYLTKPLLLHLLKAAIAKWLPRDDGDAASGAAAGEPREAPGRDQAAAEVDLGVLKGLVGDDPEIVREFLVEYRISAGRLAAELQAARAADDFRQIGAIAHKLKSSSRSVGALALGDVCAELENASRAGARAAVVQGLAQFEARLQAVDTHIGDLLAQA